jgi:hypothetical protein
LIPLLTHLSFRRTVPLSQIFRTSLNSEHVFREHPSLMGKWLEGKLAAEDLLSMSGYTEAVADILGMQGQLLWCIARWRLPGQDIASQPCCYIDVSTYLQLCTFVRMCI